MALKTTPFSAAGTFFSYQLAGATSFTQLLQVIDLEAPATTIASIDVTALMAAVKAFVASIPDNGEITFNCFLVPGDAGVVELQAMSQASVLASWKITCPDGSTVTPFASSTGSTFLFSAFLTGFKPTGFKIDDKPVVAVTLKVSGLVTFTPGS